MKTIEHYMCGLIKESSEFRKEIIALLNIRKYFSKEFNRVELNGLHLFVSADEEVVVKVVKKPMYYDEYAKQYTEELIKLLHMVDEGKKVYLLFLNKGERYKLLELSDFLNKLNLDTLSYMAKLLEVRITRGRRPTKIPLKIVQDKLREGWSFKRIYLFLIKRGYLKYKEKGEEKILTYKQFCYRLNRMGIKRIRRSESNKLAPLILHKREDIMKAYNEFKKTTDKRDWDNIDLFMSFLEGKGLISRDNMTRSLIEKLVVILRLSDYKG